MNTEKLVDYVVSQGVRGVWFWGAGNKNRSPQHFAELLSHREKARKTPRAIGHLVAGVGEQRFDHWSQIVDETKSFVADCYVGGRVAMCTGSPPAPVAAEFSLLVHKKSTHHEWLDRVDERHDKFFLVIDSMEHRGIDDVVSHQESQQYAKSLEYDCTAIRTLLIHSASEFLHVQVEPTSDELTILERAP
jgi:hypothetical protein